MTPSEITQLRTDLGLTRTQFASLLGKTERTILNWESGTVEPGKHGLTRLEALATGNTQIPLWVGNESLLMVREQARLLSLISGHATIIHGAPPSRAIPDHIPRDQFGHWIDFSPTPYIAAHERIITSYHKGQPLS